RTPRMSGCPRDLAAVDPWNASLERSRARRARSRRGRIRLGARPGGSLAALLDNRGTRPEVRDLADEQAWELSLGRSRAQRASLGALAAFTVGPTAGLASGQSGAATASANPEPTTTTEHVIVLT